jgi:hypothetical protein
MYNSLSEVVRIHNKRYPILEYGHQNEQTLSRAFLAITETDFGETSIEAMSLH